MTASGSIRPKRSGAAQASEAATVQDAKHMGIYRDEACSTTIWHGRSDARIGSGLERGGAGRDMREHPHVVSVRFSVVNVVCHCKEEC